MSTSYKVKFWETRVNTRPQGEGKKPRIVSYTVRWVVGTQESSSTYKTKGLAESFLSGLRQAARNGEAFDEASGLPESMMKVKDAVTWYAFAVDYVRAWWPHAAAKSREGMTDALANITPVLMDEMPGRPDDATLRKALREYSFVPEDRRPEPSPDIERAVKWLEGASMPLAALEAAKHTRASLEAIALLLDGSSAAISTYRRKRAVFHHLLEYAVELEELSANPLHKVKLRKTKSGGEVDKRSVVNPRQARELLTAVSYVGRSRGRMLRAMFAAMYFAGPPHPGEDAPAEQQAVHRLRGRPRRAWAQAPRRQGDARGPDPTGAGGHPPGAHRRVRRGR